MNGRTGEWTGEWMDGWLDGWMVVGELVFVWIGRNFGWWVNAVMQLRMDWVLDFVDRCRDGWTEDRVYEHMVERREGLLNAKRVPNLQALGRIRNCLMIFVDLGSLISVYLKVPSRIR